MAYKDLDLHGNTYRVFDDGTAEVIECRNTVPPPDRRLVRCGMSNVWENQDGRRIISQLTQKLMIVMGELEMEKREGVQS